MLMSAAMQLSFASWWNLLNNFAVNEIGFTGREIGIQQSLREVPGFLAFTAIFVLLILREQTFALLALLLLGIGVSLTGMMPSTWGLYFTTIIMSIGFHYYETTNQSLCLQWLPKDKAPAMMGRILSVAAMAQLVAYAVIFITWQTLHLSFELVFAIAGSLTIVMVIFLWRAFPQFEATTPQRKHLVLRKRYSLYYALTFMSGARRQIFTVFAGFMMVERFGYQVHEISALFLINCLFNMFFAPVIGRFIGQFGERRMLTIEYTGLIVVFLSYAFVSNPWMAAGLYVIDHAFFAMVIGTKTYFQKIADPADIAPTAGVAFTINHIAAVIIPVVFGLIWLAHPSAVFLIGAGLACISLVLARLIPTDPIEGREWIGKVTIPQQPAE
ncbi:MFS transporter [Cohaesibacter celericrescens]|uniref:MFS transporter n=2 Tax=Cohaesibacter celericrescens TaxID=2067669 RepID=A0A2N5XXN6_9HYPH|nr:MFS transporter [Cohaesibacter celericrescens]PLW79252.1 MFS transporter [Cohaesibacter celericrescens]